MTTPNLSLSLLVSFLFLLSSCSLSSSQPKNPRLEKAYVALQALKHSITSDPKNLSGDWCGPHVCKYTGVFCAPAPGDPRGEPTVAGLDLNHGDIAGTLPEDLGLLPDLALFHLNSNRFCGPLPRSLDKLRLLYELDVSSNSLDGPFPSVVLHLPALRYLDIRYNHFVGDVPKQLFDMRLDAIFINNNKFRFSLPENVGNSPVSVLVAANAGLTGCLPKSIGMMGKTLNELVLLNGDLKSCMPPEIGMLKELRVFDVSFNGLAGPLPEEMGGMEKLEQLDVSHNRLSGEIPASLCGLPRLKNFTFSSNYFCGEPQKCIKIPKVDDRLNCLPFRPKQRPSPECAAFLKKPIRCLDYGCLKY